MTASNRQPKVKIHFVCRGNVFRSRLAEAYARSLGHENWEISSSGTVAEQYEPDMLSPWAKILAHQQGLTPLLSKTRQQTTLRHLQEPDIIVFMNQKVLDEARALGDFNEHIGLVWDIKDREDWRGKIPLGQKRRRTFKHIKARVDQLARDLSRGGWVDIVDENNQPLDFKLPVPIMNQKGLWFRGCHAVITTPEKLTLVQKRAPHIIFSPNLIDVSLGGHVDAGETPEAAVLREIYEETGLHVTADKPQLLEVHKWKSYHPRYKKYSNAFIYTYHVPLEEANPELTRQKKEVSMMAFLPPQKLKRLVKKRHLRGVGKLNYAHAYYQRILELAKILPSV